MPPVIGVRLGIRPSSVSVWITENWVRVGVAAKLVTSTSRVHPGSVSGSFQRETCRSWPGARAATVAVLVELSVELPVPGYFCCSH